MTSFISAFVASHAVIFIAFGCSVGAMLIDEIIAKYHPSPLVTGILSLLKSLLVKAAPPA